jgi:hypothetical protein
MESTITTDHYDFNPTFVRNHQNFGGYAQIVLVWLGSFGIASLFFVSSTIFYIQQSICYDSDPSLTGNNHTPHGA